METKTIHVKTKEVPNRIDYFGTNSTFNFVVGTIAIMTAAFASFIIYSLLSI